MGTWASIVSMLVAPWMRPDPCGQPALDLLGLPRHPPLGDLALDLSTLPPQLPVGAPGASARCHPLTVGEKTARGFPQSPTGSPGRSCSVCFSSYGAWGLAPPCV